MIPKCREYLSNESTCIDGECNTRTCAKPVTYAITLLPPGKTETRADGDI